MQKILFVSHCLLNTASKVVLYNQNEIQAEDNLRIRFLSEALKKGTQFVQLPCPEFTLYGAGRWGHVSNQFYNPFFRNHCRDILQGFLDQLEEYMMYPDRFSVLGIIGIDGSPSCGVDYTCCSQKWSGAFDCREDLEETLQSVTLEEDRGIFMEVVEDLLNERGFKLPIIGLFAKEPEKLLSILKML